MEHMKTAESGVAGTGPGSGSRDAHERPVRTLRVRCPAPLLTLGAVAAVVAAPAAATVILTLAGLPPHTMTQTWDHLPQPADPWARPGTMLASALLAALGLTLAVGTLASTRGDRFLPCEYAPPPRRRRPRAASRS